MAALPYMPLYVADYLADTAHLTALENGAYLLLIMNYWQRGKALPSEPSQLARICRMSEKQFAKIIPQLENFFEVVGNTLVHHRVECELAKVRDKSAKASNAGRASAQQKANGRSTDVQRTFNHTDTDTDTEIRKKEPKVLSKEKRGSRVPDDFEPDLSCHGLADELSLSMEDVADATANFVDYWRSIPGAKGVKLDWQATFRNQLRHISKQKASSHGTKEKPSGQTREELLRILRA
jgi:uncharacterized protein YdaU (DUF1376 family)